MDLKKKASKSIAIALVGVSIITPTINTVYAISNTETLKAKEYKFNEKLVSDNTKDVYEKNFDELSENDIVCYLDGVPILKKYIDENGLIEIPKDVKNLKNSKHPDTISKYEDLSKNQGDSTHISNRATLPSGTRAEVIKRLTDTVGRFGQQTNDYYLTVSEARNLASKFDIKPWASARNYGISYLVGRYCNGAVGTAIGLADLMSTLQSADIGRKIRSYTDKNQRVRYRVIKTNYGTFYAVNYWNGKTIDLSVVSGKEKVVHKHYK